MWRKNNNPEDAFKNVPGFVKMAGLSCSVSKGSERCVLKRKTGTDALSPRRKMWIAISGRSVNG